MNSSAKILFTLISAGALGAVAIACTVSSGTVDDTDGGSSSGKSSSSSGGTSGALTDSGTDTGASSSGSTDQCVAAKTDINQNDTADCKACLRNSCCTQITAYEDKAANDTAGLLGTDAYAQQLSDCDDHPDQDPNGCKDFAKKAAQTDVPGIYDAYLTCRTTSCQAQCANVAEADGGTK